MSESLILVLIGLGVVVIAGLLVIIKKQIRHLNQLKQEQQEIHDKAQAKQDTLRLDVVESMKVISMVMLDDQVELSEGCLRIKVLIDNFDPTLHEKEEFRIFSYMADQLAHMPTHEARKQAEKKLIRKLDEQRFKLEIKHRDEIRQASEALLKWLDRPFKVVE